MFYQKEIQIENETKHVMFSKIFSLGPLLVFLFIFEGLIAKGSYPSLGISFLPHMVFTGIFFVFFFLFKNFWQTDQKSFYLKDFFATHSSILVLIFWGALSCFFQTQFFFANIIFYLFWSAFFLVNIFVVPKMLSGLNEYEKTFFFSLLLLPGLLGSFAFPLKFQGRLFGVFGNPSWSGIFLAVTMVQYLNNFLTKNFPFRFLWLPLFFLAAYLEILTRTRATIFAGFLGCGALFWFWKTDGSRGPVFLKKTIIFSCLFILVILAGKYLLEKFSGDEIAEFLRVKGGFTTLIGGRSGPWAEGINTLFDSGLFGNGFLTKFSNTFSIRVIYGIEFPTYDWNTYADPLNSFFLTSKQIGIPGGVFFLFFLFNLYHKFYRSNCDSRPLILSILVICIIHGFLNGNWLVSFGDSFDRYSIVFLFSFPVSINEKDVQTGHSERYIRPS